MQRRERPGARRCGGQRIALQDLAALAGAVDIGGSDALLLQHLAGGRRRRHRCGRPGRERCWGCCAACGSGLAAVAAAGARAFLDRAEHRADGDRRALLGPDLASTPAAGAGTSTVTLSVSSSTSGSSALTASPGFFNHWPTVASVTLSPSAGTLISMAMMSRSLVGSVSAATCRRRSVDPRVTQHGLADSWVTRYALTQPTDRSHDSDSRDQRLLLADCASRAVRWPSRPPRCGRHSAARRCLAPTCSSTHSRFGSMKVHGAHVARLLLAPDDLGQREARQLGRSARGPGTDRAARRACM